MDVNEIKRGIEVEYQKILKETSTKKFTVGPKGGTISLSGCKIRISPGALKEMRNFKLALSRDYFEVIPGYISISPVLRCKPAMKFKRPVTVTIETAFAPPLQNDGITLLLYLDAGHLLIARTGVFKLQSDGQAEFETNSLDALMIIMNVNKAVWFQMLSHVYIHKETALVVSFLCWDDMMLESFTKALENNGFHRYMSLRKYPRFRIGHNVEMEMVFKAPKRRMLLTKDQRKFDVNAAFLRSSDVRSVFYKMDPPLDEYTGPIEMEYTITSSKKGVEKSIQSASLEKHWQSPKLTKETTATGEMSRPAERQIGSTTGIVTATGNSIAAARDVKIRNGPPATILGPLVLLLVALHLGIIYNNVLLLQHITNRTPWRHVPVRSVFYKMDPPIDEYTGSIKMEYTITSSEKGNMKYRLTTRIFDIEEHFKLKRVNLEQEVIATGEMSRPAERQIGSTTGIVTAIGNSIAAARDVIIQNGPSATILVPLVLLLVVALTFANIYYNVHLLRHITNRSSQGTSSSDE